MSEICKWRETINQVFQFWTNKECPDIQALYRQSYMKNFGRGPILAAKIIRQICFKHVPYYHPAVGRACYLLQDWSPPERKPTSPWAIKSQQKESAAFNSLQQEFGNSLGALLDAGTPRDQCDDALFKVPFIPDQSSTYKRLYK